MVYGEQATDEGKRRVVEDAKGESESPASLLPPEKLRRWLDAASKSLMGLVAAGGLEPPTLGL